MVGWILSLISSLFADVAQGIRPAIAQDSAKGVTQDFTVGNAGVTELFSGVPCSQQASSPRVQAYYAQRNAVVSNQIYFSQEIDIQPNDLLVVTSFKSGYVTYYNVTGTAHPVELGTTWVWTVPCDEIDQPT